MVAATSAAFYNMGSEVTLNFPMVQGAFMFSLASMIVLQVQLTIPRCCQLYQMFRQALLDGTQTTWQFVAEAVVCTFGFAILYGVLTVIARSEEHTSELQSLMRISYAVFCFKKKNK